MAPSAPRFPPPMILILILIPTLFPSGCCFDPQSKIENPKSQRGIQNSLDHFDVLSQLTGLGQGTIDATNQVAYAVGVAQAEGRG